MIFVAMAVCVVLVHVMSSQSPCFLVQGPTPGEDEEEMSEL